jgi:hypothetical protein
VPAPRPYRYGIQYGSFEASAVGVVASHRLWEVAVQHGHPTPLVGRDAEQSALALALRMAKRGAFRCIVIDGEPGVGKTRLATDLLERSRGRVITLRARGHLSGSASPFGLWAELLDGHLRHRADDDVVRLCGGYVADLANMSCSGSSRMAC